MNAETPAAVYILAKSLYDGSQVAFANRKTTINLERKMLADTVVGLLSLNQAAPEENFLHTTGLFFVALENTVKTEGNRSGFKRWRTKRLYIPEEDGSENIISATVDGQVISISQDKEVEGVDLRRILRRDKDGHISLEVGPLIRGEAIPFAFFSTRPRTESVRGAMRAVIIEIGGEFATAVISNECAPESSLSPSERAKKRIQLTYNKWEGVHIGSVRELFTMATSFEERLKALISSDGVDGERLKLPKSTDINNGHSVNLSLSPSGSLFANRSLVTGDTFFADGINEGDQIDFRRRSSDAPLDLISGSVNIAGNSTRIAIDVKDKDNPNLEVAANAIKRIAHYSLVLS